MIRKFIYDKRYRKPKGKSRMDTGNIGCTSHRSLTKKPQKKPPHTQHKKTKKVSNTGPTKNQG